MSRAEVVLIALFTSALAATGTVYVIERSNFLKTPPPTDPVMPDVRGLSEGEARGVAGAAHIALFVTSREPSSDTHSGAILRQSVLAGQHVHADSTVNVVVADEIAKVPNVLAAPLADAVKHLEERGYSVQVGTAIADERAPVDTIVRQLPKADTAYGPPPARTALPRVELTTATQGHHAEGRSRKKTHPPNTGHPSFGG